MDRYYLQAALIVLVSVVAWLRGNHEHKIVAGTIACMFIATTAFYLLAGSNSNWQGTPVHRVIMDISAFLIFVGLWVRGDSWWLLLVSSAQLVAVFAHLARIISLPLPPLGYAVMEIWPVWFVLLVTLAALTREITRPDSQSKPL